MLPLNKPQVFVANAKDKLNTDRKLMDEDARYYVRLLTEALLELTRKIRYGNIMANIGNKTNSSSEELHPQ